MDDLKMQKQTLKKAYKKTKRKHITPWKILAIICAVVMIVSIPLSILLQKFDNTMAARFGGSFWKLQNEDANAQYYTSDFNSAEEMVNYGLALTQQVEAEGAALLMNNNNALPLAADAKVSTFSSSSVNLVYGGTGSGNIDASTADTLRTALEKVGVTVNPTLWDFYTVGAGKDYARSKSGTVAKSSEVTAEVPWDVYTDEVKDSVAQYGDAAIVTLSRVGGEGADLSYGEVNYLALDENEKAMLQNVAEMKKNGTVKKTILLINSANALQVDFLKNNEYDIDAALWIGDVGISGINAVAEILTGKVNPSGSLVDTYCYDNFSAPAMWNFTPTTYEGYVEGGDVSAKAKSYMIYQEGIYVGYKYYETRYEDFVTGNGNAGDYAYGDIVAYPFGYGMSYTDFDISDMNVSYNAADDTYTVTVKVTNTGDMAGKKTVQVYVQSPYTDYDKANGIEKAAAELCGFAKTDVLAPGASENVTVTFKAEDMASYDTYGKGCYVLEKGDYVISINADSHTVLDSKVYNVASDIVYDASNKRESDVEVADNKFDFAEGNVTYLSRADGFANYAEATAAPADFELPAEAKATFYNNSNWNPEDFNNADDVAPTTGAKNGLKLKDMVGVDYNDAQWDAFLDQLTVSDMDSLIALGGYQSVAVSSIGKVQAIDCDGPASINNNFTQQGSIGFPSAVMIAATWNTDLAHDFGTSIGKMADDMDVSGWYAPAMNIHRSAFAGRNFEYYSEDGVLSGAMAANAIMGSQEQGVYAFMKHFALNDQETNRCGMLCTWSNEQAIREIYLKPFEHCVKAADCHAVMSSSTTSATPTPATALPC